MWDKCLGQKKNHVSLMVFATLCFACYINEAIFKEVCDLLVPLSF